MKKLLTILGAVGLTATAGTTVVACTDEPAATSQKDLATLSVTLNPGTQAAATTAIGTAVDTLAKGAKLTTDYTLAFQNSATDKTAVTGDLVAGNAVVVTATSTSTLLSGSKTITVVAAATKTDLSTLSVTLNPGTQAVATSAIGTAVDTLAKGAKLTTDYTLAFQNSATDKTAVAGDLVVGNVVVVTATSTSTLLSGTQTITVVAAS